MNNKNYIIKTIPQAMRILTRILQIFSTCICSVIIKPNEMFDIVVVNLEKNKDRRAHMELILNYAKCKYEFFNAVDGNLILTRQKHISEYSKGFDIGHYVDKHKYVNEKYHGVVGLKLTSYLIYKIMEQSGNTKPLLVLEDDADLEADFVFKLEDMLSKLRDEWDIIILNNNYVLKDNLMPPDGITGLREIGMFAGTYAYLINGCATASKLANLLDICYYTDPIDKCLGAACIYSQIKGYAFTQPLATHLGNIFESNIPTSWYVGPDNLENSLYWMAATTDSFN